MTDHLAKFTAAKAPLLAERAQAQVELETAVHSLAAMPESRERRMAVSEAKRKLTEIESEIASMDAAEAEVHRQAREADRVSRNARRQEERRQLRELHPAIDEAAAAIIQHAAQLGPLLATYEELAREYSSLCVGLAREAEGHLPISRQHNTEQLRQQTDPNRGPLPEALASALWKAGLSRVGPHIAGVAPGPGRDEFHTDPLGAYTKHAEDCRRNVRDALDRADTLRAELDASAA